MNEGMHRYLNSLPPGSVKHFTVENCPALAEYERQMSEETIPKIEAALRAQRRAAHFVLLGIPDPLASASEHHQRKVVAMGDEPIPMILTCPSCSGRHIDEEALRRIEDVYREGWIDGYYAGKLSGVIDHKSDWQMSDAAAFLKQLSGEGG